MTTMIMQRDRVTTYKKEIVLNLGILSKLQPMAPDISRHVFEEKALEKPTQNLFNHLSHYLVSIIDPQAYKSLSWPLYDTKQERSYRNELASFIGDYSNKGFLSPVMSSYFVNPGCFKVIKLMFQLSQLALQKLLTLRMEKESQRKLYSDITEKYKSQEEGFIDHVEQVTGIMLSKFSNYMCERRALENIAETFRKKIFVMEAKLKSLNAQKFIDDLVDDYITKNMLDDAMKEEILNIKNVYKPSQFFESWLVGTDQKIDQMESKWGEKVSPLLQTCKKCKFSTESLIARHTGEADKNSYMIEYNHKTDEICTKDLQNQVNSEQKYILKNVIKDEKLNFPNLVRGFLIAISFILKNAEIGDEIYKFNDYIDEKQRNYKDVVEALKDLLERVMNAEAKLEPPVIYHRAISIKDFQEIPPLPDLSVLYCTRDLQQQILIDNFTPLTMSKHQFNLRRKLHTFVKPQSKSLFIKPFNQGPKEDFMKSLISCRISSYDRLNSTQNFHNMSMASQPNKANETIAECSAAFTKEQIQRLLSTKKSSSSKKFKHKTDRSTINIKKGGLFNDSNSSNESRHGLFRSQSSPNLYEHREKRAVMEGRHRKLSIMQEDSRTLLEVSGVSVLDNESNSSTPHDNNTESVKNSHVSHIPVVVLTQSSNTEQFNEIIKDYNTDLNDVMVGATSRIPASEEVEIKTGTPINNTQVIRKTSSLEKIINRFKKVRANILPKDDHEKSSDFGTITEEKENMSVNIFTANRNLLPDLLSPSYSVISKVSVDNLNEMCMDVDKQEYRNPRESLGTVLGVDETFLDQFDFID